MVAAAESWRSATFALSSRRVPGRFNVRTIVFAGTGSPAFGLERFAGELIAHSMHTMSLGAALLLRFRADPSSRTFKCLHLLACDILALLIRRSLVRAQVGEP